MAEHGFFHFFPGAEIYAIGGRLVNRTVCDFFDGWNDKLRGFAFSEICVNPCFKHAVFPLDGIFSRINHYGCIGADIFQQVEVVERKILADKEVKDDYLNIKLRDGFQRF